MIILCHLSEMHTLEKSCDFTSLQKDDKDGSMLLINTLLQQLSQLIHAKDVQELSEQDICTMDTIVYGVLDVYLQSEVALKIALARMIGDNYISCLNDVNEVVHNSFGRCTL